MSDSRSSLIAVVIDLNPLAWGLRTIIEQQHAQQTDRVQQRAETVVQGLDAVLTFINSFLLMTHGNEVAVIGVHPFGSGTCFFLSSRSFLRFSFDFVVLV